MALAQLLSNLKRLEAVKAIATNIAVVPETKLKCQMALDGCPLVADCAAAKDRKSGE